MDLRLGLLASSLLLTACVKSPTPGGDDSNSGFMLTSSGDESLGMGVTSASESDPTLPTVPTSTEADSFPGTITASVGTSTFPETTDPTIPLPSTDASDTEFTTTVPETTTFPDDTTDPQSCADVPGQPQDAECTDDSGCGCSSGSCFLVPILGGWCGECRVDSDCPDGGCTVPNPLAGTGSVCNLGKPGDGCMTGDVCFVPIASFCAPILVIPGIIEVATCSECGDNGDCPNSAPNCTPDYNILSFTGIHTCVPNASVPQDGGCSLVEDGDKACDSGFCGEANVMGLLKVGICGECNSDQDCGNNQSCTDPVVDLASGQLIGSICQ